MKMKKIGLVLAGTLLATSVFAQAEKQPEIEAKEELKAPGSISLMAQSSIVL